MKKIISIVVLCIAAAHVSAKTTAWIGGTGSLSNEAGWNNGLPAAVGTSVIIKKSGPESRECGSWLDVV